MSTWQILSDSSSDGFRWEVGGRILHSDSVSTPTTTAPLPSMADLLLQGDSSSDSFVSSPMAGRIPMFSNGLGKSVSLKESSIAKAKSILAADAFSDFQNTRCSNLQNGQVDTARILPTFSKMDSDNTLPRENGFNVSSTLFQTASNKKINVSSHGLARAKALLGVGLEEFNLVNPSFSSHQQHRLKSHQEFDATPAQHHSGQYESQPPTRFQTASGKSLSVSADALKRARNLLGDPELCTFFDEIEAGDQFVTPQKDIAINSGSANTGYVAPQGNSSNKHTPNSFISPIQSSSKRFRSVKVQNLASGSNLIKKFDAAVDETATNDRPLASDMAVSNSKENGFIPRAKQFGRREPLVDITNGSDIAKQDSAQKKRLRTTVSVSSFKRPRNSSFETPLKQNAQHASSGLSSDTPYSKEVLSTRHRERSPRLYIKDYFGMHPRGTTEIDYVPDHVRRIKSSNADKYVFWDESSSNVVGADTFLQMLAESGASVQHASRMWVTNHYKWIVWKLASYEKNFPDKCRGNFLTVTNVFEELKYRYEREANHGHCSAIKRILNGDAPALSMMVLCISSLNPKTNDDSQEEHGSASGGNVKVELTDGWYSMNASLDAMLTKQLNAGKLFVGQKIRILGAGLSGWSTPTSPLETVTSNTICLLLNINGTYRTHWADRLGFCKEVGVPLAFNCIKCNGGPVPKTLAGITRIYPILYKERLGERNSIVRSERMESRMVQLHSQRRLALIEDLICEYERGINGVNSQNDPDNEGAKVYKLLETAEEPEILMADMSIEQLTSFSTYKAKFEAAREMQNKKSVAKALDDAGLGERDVIPFMRIRLVGLTSLSYEGKHNPKEGMVTIWNPTDRQRTELTEGQMYIMKGLAPVNSDSDLLYLHGRGSSSSWQPLSPKASEIFQPFFNHRKPLSLSDLSEIPLSSEFDIAAYVVYVGVAYTDVQQRKQWVFVTDGSTQRSKNLLAISFSAPSMNDLPIPQISNSLVGSVVGFCNLIKRAKDAQNDILVGEATENSVYFINAEDAYSSHLRTRTAQIQKWAKLSSSNSVINALRQRVVSVVGNRKAQSCSR